MAKTAKPKQEEVVLPTPEEPTTPVEVVAEPEAIEQPENTVAVIPEPEPTPEIVEVVIGNS